MKIERKKVLNREGRGLALCSSQMCSESQHEVREAHAEGGGVAGDAEGLEVWEMLNHFPPAPQSRPASRSRYLYLRPDPKTSSNEPRQIARAIPGGSEAADHYH